MFRIDSSKTHDFTKEEERKEGQRMGSISRFLESFSGSNITSRVLSSLNEVSFAEIKKEILNTDFEILQSVSATHPSQCMVQKIAAFLNSSWPK